MYNIFTLLFTVGERIKGEHDFSLNEQEHYHMDEASNEKHGKYCLKKETMASIERQIYMQIYITIRNQKIRKRLNKGGKKESDEEGDCYFLFLFY